MVMKMALEHAREAFMKRAPYSEEAQALLWPFRDTLEDHPRSLGLLDPEVFRAHVKTK